MKASRHSAVGAQPGMQPRRFKSDEALCLKCNCFIKVLGIAHLPLPGLFSFPHRRDNRYSSLETFCLNHVNACVGSGGGGEETVINSFTCQRQTEREQRLSHVFSQAGLQRDHTL